MEWWSILIEKLFRSKRVDELEKEVIRLQEQNKNLDEKYKALEKKLDFASSFLIEVQKDNARIQGTIDVILNKKLSDGK
ncbi:MAG: hypothetical protein MUC49_14725 [Raineya sp.]|jgi:uncharacterized protein YlxW (UPF0749 family)|nr:hypothetical protein [Raineya sp.]